MGVVRARPSPHHGVVVLRNELQSKCFHFSVPSKAGIRGAEREREREEGGGGVRDEIFNIHLYRAPPFRSPRLARSLKNVVPFWKVQRRVRRRRGQQRSLYRLRAVRRPIRDSAVGAHVCASLAVPRRARHVSPLTPGGRRGADLCPRVLRIPQLCSQPREVPRQRRRHPQGAAAATVASAPSAPARAPPLKLLCGSREEALDGAPQLQVRHIRDAARRPGFALPAPPAHARGTPMLLLAFAAAAIVVVVVACVQRVGPRRVPASPPHEAARGAHGVATQPPPPPHDLSGAKLLKKWLRQQVGAGQVCEPHPPAVHDREGVEGMLLKLTIRRQRRRRRRWRRHRPFSRRAQHASKLRGERCDQRITLLRRRAACRVGQGRQQACRGSRRQ
eukprot:Rhum_TRINITY_DN14797_c4_g3::Rhum_TRINITY_DN14797_c4_g3_i1::g.117080::m.117080